MPSVLQPARKKQKTVRVFTTDQKRWLIYLRDKNPGVQQMRLAQEVRDTFSGDWLSSSTVSDWLKPDASYSDQRIRKNTSMYLILKAEVFF